MEVQPESWGDYLPSNRTIQFLIFPLCAQKNLKIKYCTMTYCSSICSKKKKNALRARGSPNLKKKIALLSIKQLKYLTNLFHYIPETHKKWKQHAVVTWIPFS